MMKHPGMMRNPGDRVFRRSMTRRDFLWLMSATGVGLATGSLHGCATDPVTGKTILVGLSEGQERALDQQQSPHQFSADYGAVQDGQLNDYLGGIGGKLAALSHRPQMPYSFRAVNANHVNAYAFPGGSIGVTRGMLVEIDNEAEMAGLLGHEIGHVTARHAAEQAGKTMVAQAAVMSGAVYASSRQAGLGNLVASLGSIGAGALLASYSRNNERESDRLGMEYMTEAGYNPSGMTGLMDALRRQNQRQPGAIELMFSTHPQSDERYQTAQQAITKEYGQYRNAPVYRDRYMDNTASLRKIKGAINELQEGEKDMARKQYSQAEAHFREALRQAPSDYAGHVLLGKALLAQDRKQEAESVFSQAKAIYPQEAQARHLSGISKLYSRNYAAAYREFDAYEKLLPGNPNTIFLKGIALESTQNKRAAAREYYRYLQSVNQGKAAQYAQRRLVNWGYLGQ